MQAIVRFVLVATLLVTCTGCPLSVTVRQTPAHPTVDDSMRVVFAAALGEKGLAVTWSDITQPPGWKATPAGNDLVFEGKAPMGSSRKDLGDYANLRFTSAKASAQGYEDAATKYEIDVQPYEYWIRKVIDPHLPVSGTGQISIPMQMEREFPPAPERMPASWCFLGCIKGLVEGDSWWVSTSDGTIASRVGPLPPILQKCAGGAEGFNLYKFEMATSYGHKVITRRDLVLHIQFRSTTERRTLEVGEIKCHFE